jgi:hypothetical protein
MADTYWIEQPIVHLKVSTLYLSSKIIQRVQADLLTFQVSHIFSSSVTNFNKPKGGT